MSAKKTTAKKTAKSKATKPAAKSVKVKSDAKPKTFHDLHVAWLCGELRHRLSLLAVPGQFVRREIVRQLELSIEQATND